MIFDWIRRASVSVVIAVFTSGCLPPVSLYSWQGHKTAMLALYEDGDAAEARQQLWESISVAEKWRKVPPGLYAEYGFLLYQRGLYSEAIDFFGRERALFPESAAFMTTIIAKVEKKRDDLAATSLEANP